MKARGKSKVPRFQDTAVGEVNIKPIGLSHFVSQRPQGPLRRSLERGLGTWSQSLWGALGGHLLHEQWQVLSLSVELRKGHHG